MQPAKLKIDRPIRILVDRRKAVGDVVMITPVLRELRKRYGADAFIQVVTEEVIVLANNSVINRVVSPSDMKPEDAWDLYINLNDAYEHNITSHYVDAYLYRAFGTADGIDKTLTLESSQEEQDNIHDAIADIGGDYIVMHMRRWAWENKNVDPVTWTALMVWMEHTYPGVKMISVGSQYDMRVPTQSGEHYIDLVDQLSIGELKELIAGAKMFIGGDSGPYHIAATTQTPIVAMLTHLAPEQILPWRDGVFGKGVSVVQSDVPCLGCYARQQAPVRNLVCENPEQWACNKNFSPSKLTHAVNDILKT